MTRYSLFENLYKAQLPPPVWLEASLERAWGFVRPRKSAMFHTLYLLVRKIYAPYRKYGADVRAIREQQISGAAFTPFLDHPREEDLGILAQEVGRCN